MKRQRALPFGYEMKAGIIRIVPREKELVIEIYKLYESGESIASIADIVSKQDIPFWVTNPSWDKHKIKRILADGRYIGEKGFPEIVDKNVYYNVRNIYSSKSHTQKANPTKHVWTKLLCMECGGKVVRTGGKILRCKSCGGRYDYSADDFIQKLKELWTCEDTANENVEYVPSSEIQKLENLIAMNTERMIEPENIANMILQNLALKYERCKKDIPREFDMKIFIHEVTSIIVGTDEVRII